MPERRYDLPGHERDRIILVLHDRGLSLAQIGARVGMSRSGVSRAIARLNDDDDEDDG